jgi:ubiquinone biosynthesis protein
MVVVEGVARKLDPQFNMWKASEPVVGEWIARKLGPVGKLQDAKDGLDAVVRLVHQLPDFAERAERLSKEIDVMSQNGIRLDAPTIEAIGKAEAQHSRSGRLALMVIAAAAVIALLRF